MYMYIGALILWESKKIKKKRIGKKLLDQRLKDVTADVTAGEEKLKGQKHYYR